MGAKYAENSRLGQEELGGVAGDPDQQEHDQRDPEEGRDHLAETPTEIGQHARRAPQRKPG